MNFYIPNITERDGLTRLVFDMPGGVAASGDMIPVINACGFLLPLELAERRGSCLLTYDAGDLISLSKYFRQNKPPKDTVLSMLKKICACVISCGEARLYPENLSFSADHIFWDSFTSALRMIYFPFETGSRTAEGLRAVFSKIFGELLFRDESGDCHYIERIMECYRKPGFTAYGLMELIGELEARETAQKRKKKKFSLNIAKPDFLDRLFKKEPPRGQEPPEPAAERPSPIPRMAEIREGSGGTSLLIQRESPAHSPGNPAIRLTIYVNGEPREVGIHSFPCLLGRSPQANVTIEDKSVSREHAVISRENGEFFIVDGDSRNGVTVNAEKCAPGAPCLLHTGDIVKLGRAEMRVAGTGG